MGSLAMKYEVTTTPRTDGSIEQVTALQDFGEPFSVREEISRNILRAQDQGIKQALVQLGWTPPNG